MIAELFLGLSNVAILAAFVLYVREQQKEKQKLINALVSRNAQELANTTFADNTKVTPEMARPDPDLIPMDQLNEEQFDKMIQQTLGTEVSDEEHV